MLKKLYEKSKIRFSVLWIAVYCVAMSVADSLSVAAGVEKSVTLGVGLLLSVVLLVFLKKNKLFAAFGLRKPKVSARSMLYYLPLVIMVSTNLWYGVRENYGVVESILYVLSMLSVGFLEEIIFRGMLFNAMRRDNVKAAIIVSSVTFGVGHIINLLNGSGADLFPNLLQVVYATAAGFMFVMIYFKSESLVGCIAAHGIFNALSVVADESAATPATRIVFALVLTLITSSYAVYLAVTANWNDTELADL